MKKNDMKKIAIGIIMVTASAWGTAYAEPHAGVRFPDFPPLRSADYGAGCAEYTQE